MERFDPWRATGVALALSGSPAFAVQYLLFFVVQQRGGPVYISLLGSVAAVVGSAIAIGVLGEAAPRGLFVGGVLITLGLVLLTRGGAKSA